MAVELDFESSFAPTRPRAPASGQQGPTDDGTTSQVKLDFESSYKPSRKAAAMPSVTRPEPTSNTQAAPTAGQIKRPEPAGFLSDPIGDGGKSSHPNEGSFGERVARGGVPGALASYVADVPVIGRAASMVADASNTAAAQSVGVLSGVLRAAGDLNDYTLPGQLSKRASAVVAPGAREATDAALGATHKAAGEKVAEIQGHYADNSIGHHAMGVASSVPQMAAAVGTSIIGSPLAGAAVMGATTGADSYAGALDEGHGKGKAALSGLAQGVLEGGMDYVTLGMAKYGVKPVMDKLASKLGSEAANRIVQKLTGNAAARIGTAAAEEALTEIATTAGQMGADMAILDKQYSADDWWKGLRDSGIQGGVMGGGAYAAGHLASPERQPGAQIQNPRRPEPAAAPVPLQLPAPEGFTVGPDGAATRGIQRPQVFAQPEMSFPQGRGMSAPAPIGPNVRRPIPAGPITQAVEPTLADGSPIPDPANGPISKGVNAAIDAGAVPVSIPFPEAAPGSLADIANDIVARGAGPRAGGNAENLPPNAEPANALIELDFESAYGAARTPQPSQLTAAAPTLWNASMQGVKQGGGNSAPPFSDTAPGLGNTAQASARADPSAKGTYRYTDSGIPLSTTEARSTDKQYSAKLSPTDEQLNDLRERFGGFEPWWRDTSGHGFEGLTASEAQSVLSLEGSPSADAIRNRVDAARVQISDGMGGRAVPDRPGTEAPGAGGELSQQVGGGQFGQRGPETFRYTESTTANAAGVPMIAAAAHEAATSPRNDIPLPTEAQIKVGNYRKGHVSLNGLDISIENPAGSKRRPEWPALKNHYGYIRGTIGKDKDHVDVFMTDRAEDPNLPVFVVDQVDKDGTFDEHKVVMGARDEAEARKTYLANYSNGWTGLGAITRMPQNEFKAWVYDQRKTKRPAGKLVNREVVTDQSSEVAGPTSINTLVGRIADGLHPREVLKGLDDSTARAVAATMGYHFAKMAKAGNIASNIGAKARPAVRRAAEQAFAAKATPEEKATRSVRHESTALLQREAPGGRRRAPLGKQKVQEFAVRILGVDPDKGAIPVVTLDTAEQLPQAIRNYLKAEGTPTEEIRGVHWRGKSYLVADQLSNLAEVEETVFHEHYTHGGLRARYGNRLGAELTRLLRGIGGLEGLQTLASDQGIDLSAYKKVLASSTAIPEKLKPLVLMEELLAHASRATGTLKRVIQEWVGALRAWLRANKYAELAEYGITDLAHVLRQAREAARTKKATKTDTPFFSRTAPRIQTDGRGQRSVVVDGETFIDRSGKFYLADAAGQPKDFISLGAAQDAAKRTGGDVLQDDAVEGERPTWSVVLPTPPNVPFFQRVSQGEQTATTAQGALDFPHLSNAQRMALGKITTFAPREPLRDRLSRQTERWRAKVVQGVFDQFAPLKDLDDTAYMQARLSKGTDGAMEAAFRFGPPKLTDDALDVAADGKGLQGYLQALAGEHDLFLAWLAGNRAEALKADGRERLFSDDEITALKDLSLGRMADGRVRSKVYEETRRAFNRYQKAVLDIAEQAGILDPEHRKLWAHDFYVPFYRVMEGDKAVPPGMVGGLVRQKAFERLKGGTEPLGDLLANTLTNWSHLLSASMKNMAAKRALGSAEDMGIATPATSSDKGTVWVMENGQQKHYTVSDPLVFDALTMLHHPGWTNPAMKAMQWFKRALTTGVTADPAFRIRNLLRDTVSSIASNRVGYNPVRNLVDGWKATDRGNDTYLRLLGGGGAIRFGTLLDGNQADNAKRLIKAGIATDAQLLDTPAKVKAVFSRAWHQWQEIGDRMETVNRAVAYQHARDAGGSHLEASYAARDLLDFTMGGKWAAVRFLTQVVPFMNARLQGVYKLGRAAKTDPRRFIAVTGAVAMASVLLHLLNEDDEEYQVLPDWVRDTYWWVRLPGTEQAMFIPKPFEIGALGSIAERGTELMTGGDDYTARDFGGTLLSILNDQLAMNPVPQAFRPLMEAAFNRNSFQNRPIDGMGQEQLPPADRYTARTSTGAIAAGKVLNVSPQRLEHMARGYFGWLGSQALAVSDLVGRSLFDMPANPAHDFTQPGNLAIVGAFVRPSQGSGSKYMNRYYDQKKEVDQLYAAYSAARKAGDIERAAELYQDNRLRLRGLYRAADRQMRSVNQQIRQVTSNRTLSAHEKSEMLAGLYAVRERVSKWTTEEARRRTAEPQ